MLYHIHIYTCKNIIFISVKYLQLQNMYGNLVQWKNHSWESLLVTCNKILLLFHLHYTYLQQEVELVFSKVPKSLKCCDSNYDPLGGVACIEAAIYNTSCCCFFFYSPFLFLLCYEGQTTLQRVVERKISGNRVRGEDCFLKFEGLK